MLKSLRIRRLLGLAVAILGVAVLAIAADPPPPPPGACLVNDAAWATADGGCKDLVSGLVWSSRGGIRIGGTFDYKYAVASCADLTEGGYSDWRLPSKTEFPPAASHGARYHLAPVPFCPDCWTFWAIEKKGTKATWANLIDGLSSLFPMKSYTDFFCVRP